jgi:hypothetical protein
LPDAAEDAVSRLGDLWQVGVHSVLCGDARLAESWEWLLGKDRAKPTHLKLKS